MVSCLTMTTQRRMSWEATRTPDGRIKSRRLLMCLNSLLHLNLVLLPQDRLVDLRRHCQEPLAAPPCVRRLKSQANQGRESKLARFLHLRLLRLRWQGERHRRCPKQNHRQVPHTLSVWCSSRRLLLLLHQGYLRDRRHHHHQCHHLPGHRQPHHLSSVWQCRHRHKLLALPQGLRQFIKFPPLLR